MSIAATSGMIAQVVGGELVGTPEVKIDGLAGLDQARAGTLSFIRNAKYAPLWATSKAGAALVKHGVEVPGHDPSTRALIYVEDADLAMLKLLESIAKQLPDHTPLTGVHSSAIIDPTARIAPTAKIGASCVIGPGTEIGEHVILHPRVTLGANVEIGAGSILHPGVVIYDRCVIGLKCILHGGVVIGADGFGFLPAPSGQGLLKVPHVGFTQIGNGVEIGANSCVDRGKFGATVIGEGSKIDNLVQIAHNCRLGRCVIVCGVTGIGGSVTIGDGAMIGGACGIKDNMTIGAGAKIGAKSAVMNNVPAGEAWTGYPAQPHREQMRTWSAVRKLHEVLRELMKNGVIHESDSPSRGFDASGGRWRVGEKHEE